MKNPFRLLSATGKHLLLAGVLFLGLAFVVTAFTGCSTPPNQRVAAGQTLKATGQTAEAVVALSAQLYRDGYLSAAKAREVADFYDKQFQPAYRAAVVAARSDLSSFASADVLRLLAQLQALLPPPQKREPIASVVDEVMRRYAQRDPAPASALPWTTYEHTIDAALTRAARL